MNNTKTLPNISVYACGNGVLAVRNPNNVALTEEAIRAWLKENSPELAEYDIYNVNKEGESYWRLARAYTTLSQDSNGIPTVIKDVVTNAIYMVTIHHSDYHPEHGFNLYSLTVTSSYDGIRFELKNLSTRLAVLAYINREYKGC